MVIVGIEGMAMMDGRIADGGVAAYVITFTLAAICVLFALKVARRYDGRPFRLFLPIRFTMGRDHVDRAAGRVGDCRRGGAG